MEPLVNAFLAIGLLVVIILIVYLVDRVNSIERETRRVVQSMSPASSAASQDPFAGLSGKALWDALSGKPPAGMAEATLQDIRSRYELVLHKHIQSLFDEGVKDAQRGLSGEPNNARMIRTAKAAVESWMPAPQANSIYKCGMDSVQQLPEAWGPVRASLDEAGQLLFAKVQLEYKEPLSASLMPQAPQAIGADASASAGSTAPAAAVAAQGDRPATGDAPLQNP